MNALITVLSVGKPYDIAPESGVGEHTVGCTTGDISASNYNEGTGTLGYAPVKEKMPVEFYEVAKATGLPAVASVEFGMKASGGKNVLYIQKLDFVQSSGKAAK